MEKISIVRRRLEVSPTQAELRARERLSNRGASRLGESAGLAVLPGSEAAPASGGDRKGVSVDLSQEAREELWAGGHIDETAAGRRHFIVEAERDKEDGRVVLKLQFMKPEYYLRLLTTEEVCEMLHVSKSSLYHYAREGMVKTYRMGRNLRFRFQDVLDFITGCQIRKT